MGELQCLERERTELKGQLVGIGRTTSVRMCSENVPRISAGDVKE